MNGRGDLGKGSVTVNNSGTLGGDSTSAIIRRDPRDDARDRLTVAAGGNLAPGNGGNNTGVITLHALTLQPASNFRIDINGTSPGGGYDRLVLTGAGNNRYVITNSNLVVSVGTTLSVGQTFLIVLRTAGGSIRGEFAQGNSVVGSDVRLLGQLHRRRWQRHRAHGGPGARSRASDHCGRSARRSRAVLASAVAIDSLRAPAWRLSEDAVCFEFTMKRANLRRKWPTIPKTAQGPSRTHANPACAASFGICYKRFSRYKD